MNSVETKYDPAAMAHVAILPATHGAVKVMVQVDHFQHQGLLNELWLYQFDADGNGIEFPFGVRHQDVQRQFYITYETNAAVHRPPFRIEIRHQQDSEDLAAYGFTIFWEQL